MNEKTVSAGGRTAAYGFGISNYRKPPIRELHKQDFIREWKLVEQKKPLFPLNRWSESMILMVKAIHIKP